MRLLQMVKYVMTKGLFHQEHVRHGSVCWKQNRRSRRVAFIHRSVSSVILASLVSSVAGFFQVCHCKLLFGLLKTEVCVMFEL